MSHCEDDAVSMIVSCYCSEWLNIQLLCSCNQSIRFEITNLQLLFCFPHSELVTIWPRTLSPGFVSMKTRDRISVVSLLITWPKIFDFGQVLFSSACMCLSVCLCVCLSVGESLNPLSQKVLV